MSIGQLIRNKNTSPVGEKLESSSPWMWHYMSASSDLRTIIGACAEIVYPNNFVVQISRDFGETWAEVPFFFTRQISHVFCSSDGSKMYVVPRFQAQIYKSVDFGNTWTTFTTPMGSISNNLIRHFDGMPNGETLVAANNGSVYVSTNGGASWVLKYTSPSFYSPIASIDASASAIAVSVVDGSSNLRISTNDGNSWDTFVARAGGNILVSDDRSKVVCIDASYIYFSHDFGVSWAQSNAPRNSWEKVVASADLKTLFATNGSSGDYRIYTSTDYGATWNILKNAPPDDWREAIVISADGTKGLAAPYGLSGIFKL